jgi:hypothetical protein
MSSRYWVRQDKSVSGPFTAKQLKDFSASGRISLVTLISKAETGPWVKAGTVPGLREQFERSPSSLAGISDSAATGDVDVDKDALARHDRMAGARLICYGFGVLAAHYLLVNLTGFFFPYILVAAPGLILVGGITLGSPRFLDAIYNLPGTPWWAYAGSFLTAAIGLLGGFYLVATESGVDFSRW